MLSKRLITVYADLDHLFKIAFVRFFHCKVIFFSAVSCCVLWKETTMHSAIKKWRFTSAFSKPEYVYKSFVTLVQRRSVFSINQSYIYISIDSWVSNLNFVLYSNTALFYCSDCSSLALGNSFSGILYHFHILPSVCYLLLVWALSHFLEPWLSIIIMNSSFIVVLLGARWEV